MKVKKNLAISSGLLLLLFVLSGCVDTYKSGPKAGQPTGEGIIYNLLVEPMSHAVQFFANNLNLGYGIAIIAITIIVRILILPLGLHSSKQMLIQQYKMAKIQPEMNKIREQIKTASTQEEQMKLNLAMSELMKKNDISMFGGMGCLPLLLQMPIFTALFFAARYTPGISSAEFLDINLGSPNFVLTLLAAGSYLLQGYLSSLSMPKDQRKQMQMTMFMSPIMIFFVSVNSPAGVTLYWVVGGLVSCLQVLITNFYHKPRIQKKLDAYFEEHPLQTDIDLDQIKLPITPNNNNEQKTSHPVTPREDDIVNRSKRNAGKQHRHK